MDPDGRALPFRRPEGCFPRRGRCAAVDCAAQRGDRSAGLRVSRRQRHTPEGVVLPRLRSICRIDSLQGGDELCQVGRRLAWVGNGLDGRGFALEPPIDRPVPGVALGGAPLRERDRDGKG